ncbi:MAG TPA: DNA-protecting protein DprA, partial [Balneolaceae bacterium]|nr:DNA-protecting protein DprA [Balneolaceae bacterium]
FPLGTNPDAGNFPVRNRVVSGMSMGVLVIESGIKGGSMITADLGLDQNREVFAVPHPIGNPTGTGCNYLIKRGAAKLVQTVDDILEELLVEYHSDESKSKATEAEKTS